MNLLEGTLVEKAGRRVFQGKGFSLDLGEFKLEGFREGFEIGIRPEDMEILPPGKTPLKAGVDLVSNIGSEMLVHARLGNETISIRPPKDAALQPGDTVSVSIDPERVHRFHKGRRVEKQDSPERR